MEKNKTQKTYETGENCARFFTSKTVIFCQKIFYVKLFVKRR